MRRLLLGLAVVAGLWGAGVAPALGAPPASQADRALDRALRGLVAMPGGPPGAIAVVQRGQRRKVHVAGVADVRTGAPLRIRKQMRIASVSKAFSGAVALTLVDEGVLSLDDTIGDLLPDLPTDWHPVTLEQLLAHTSRLPDYTGSQGLVDGITASPVIAPPPRELLGYVAEDGLVPGDGYIYSNSDNIAIGLIVEAALGASYERSIRAKVAAPLRLRRTAMGVGALLPRPFIHGYERVGAGGLEDQSQQIGWGGWAWASGGIVSTPGNLNRFVRAYAGGELFLGQARRRQYRFIPGAESHPPGPGANAGGLALFRYRTRCGTVFGHTGSIPGYTQLIASTRNGRRSLTFTVTRQMPDELLPALRRAQVRAVCAAKAKPRPRRPR
ncbi:MAG TPA: serine hydrolase domain-containing protein [Solirubrobacterales bacterium]|nr:serine hydrolase domain-containing protein [Solirubrobacterales bacterium]